LGGPAYASLTRADEAQIGQMIINQIRNQNLLLQDPEVDEYLQDLGMRLASQAHDPDQQFHYVCMRDPEINAFATFGGYVFVFTGLILVTHNEAELASVMAHETGHVVQRHMARALEAESHMSLASTAAMLAAALLGAAAGGPNSGEAIEGAIATAQAVTMQRAINYTRSQEMEADYVGIHLLAAAGFDPYAMANFFETLQQSMGMAESEIPALLIDHPVTDERIAAARSRAAQFQRLTSYEESSLYPFIKERVRVLSAPPEARIAQYYAGLRERRELTPAERYGEALVQVQEGHASQAVPTLRQLQAGHPEMILLYTALGQALQAAGKPREALAQFALAEQLFPHNVPLTVHYAETLMKTGQPAQAHALLLDLFNNVDPTPPQIQLTAIAASAAGDTGDAYYYMGEYNLANGQLALADQELELALASPHLSNIQRARFLARLEQVRGWMREQQAARHGG
jgi:predicted Zn-dependent protease